MIKKISLLSCILLFANQLFSASNESINSLIQPLSLLNQPTEQTHESTNSFIEPVLTINQPTEELQTSYAPYHVYRIGKTTIHYHLPSNIFNDQNDLNIKVWNFIENNQIDYHDFGCLLLHQYEEEKISALQTLTQICNYKIVINRTQTHNGHQFQMMYTKNTGWPILRCIRVMPIEDIFEWLRARANY